MKIILSHLSQNTKKSPATTVDRQRRLPEIDLARITTLPIDKQRQALQAMRSVCVPFSYEPFRKSLVDIFNIQTDMFASLDLTEWRHIEYKLRKDCSKETQLEANVMVAKGLHSFLGSHPISGRKQEFSPIRIGAFGSLTFWLPYILSWKGQTLIPFIDPRITYGLNEQGRRFVFSLMHERIRVPNPDYANVCFSIFGFSKKDFKAGIRYAEIYTDQEVRLFSMDEIQHMLSCTYELWLEIGNGQVAQPQHRQAM